MADYMNYQFGPMQETNDAVHQRLIEFGSTLEAFKATYTRLAQQWGGSAAQGATEVAKSLDDFGVDVQKVVQTFHTKLDEHLTASKDMERLNTGMFA